MFPPHKKKSTVRTSQHVLVCEKGCCKVRNFFWDGWNFEPKFRSSRLKHCARATISSSQRGIYYFDYTCFRLLHLMIRLFLGIDFANTEMMDMLISWCAMVLQSHPFLGTSIYWRSRFQVGKIRPNSCFDYLSYLQRRNPHWRYLLGLVDSVCTHVSMLNPHVVGLCWYS